MKFSLLCFGHMVDFLVLIISFFGEVHIFSHQIIIGFNFFFSNTSDAILKISQILFHNILAFVTLE
jgi:hypothetical protein